MPQHAIAIVAGTLLALYGNQLPDRFWAAYLPLLLLLCRYCPAWRFLLLVAAAHLWSLAGLHYHLDHRLIDAYDNRVVLVRGTVDGIPERRPGRIGFSLDNLTIDGYPGRLPRHIRVAWYQQDAVPLAGERWQLVVKLRQPRGLLNPAGFDYTAWQFAVGRDASGYVRDSPANRRLAAAGGFALHRWRQGLADSIDAHCPECPRAGLIKALAIGYRGDIPARQRTILQHSATAHLLAISGLHIGMVALLGYGAGRGLWRLGLHRVTASRPRLAAVLAMTAACGYAAMAGFSLPTMRALIMLLVLLLALLLRNRVNLLQSLALAIATITLADPRSLASSSFWLSCGALLVIAFVQFRVPQALPGWRRLLTLQLYFTLLFAPLGMLIFGQWAPAGLPANLLAIPALSLLILPLVLSGCLLACGGLPGAGLLLGVADRALEALLAALEGMMAPGLDAVAATYPWPLLLVLLATLFWMLMPRAWPGRWSAVLTAMLLLAWQPARPQFGEYRLWVLDVGMGTSVLLRTRHHSLVYDLGPGRPGGFSAAEAALLPAMRQSRTGAPDLVVVSHVDQDHSGGLGAFLEAYPKATVVSGTPAELAQKFTLQSPIASCHDMRPWQWDGVGFAFLGAVDGGGTNDRSCVLRIDGSHRILLAGDIEDRREASLVAEYGEALAADLLLVPHHGSDTSSSAALLDRVAPGYAVFTLSRGNRWGFPSAAIVERYRRRGIRLYDTARDGAIAIDSGPRELRIESLRGTPRRIWQRW